MSEAYWDEYRSNIDKQVERAGLSKGLGDNPGAGRPLPDSGQPYRENWWLQDFVKHKGVSKEHYLPTSLLLKAKVDQIDDDVAGLPTENEVRRRVSELNKRIRAWLRAPTPPRVALAPVAADAVVERWRRRTGTVDREPSHEDRSGGPPPARERSFWSRLVPSSLRRESRSP